MLKRPKGYFLLTMLVLTGLAGRLHSDTLTGKERRLLLNDLKVTRSAFLESVKDLSKKQFDFKPSKNSLSIRDYVYEVAKTEKGFRDMIKESLQQQTNPARPVTDHITDEQLAILMAQKDHALVELCGSPAIRFHKSEDAITTFKNESAELLRYVRTTTDNLRKPAISTTAGPLDVYQAIVVISDYTNECVKKIAGLKKKRSFPK